MRCHIAILGTLFGLYYFWFAEDGKISRMSDLDDPELWESCDLDLKQDHSDDCQTPKNPPQKFDLEKSILRESVLMNDFEEMESKLREEELEEVKALK